MKMLIYGTAHGSTDRGLAINYLLTKLYTRYRNEG